MSLPRDAQLLRIFMGESQHHGGHPLFEAIVLKAREMGMAGATVLRGPLGFGHSSKLHTAKILQLSEDLPVVVEIVESEASIRALLDAIEPMFAGTSVLVTQSPVTVLRYGAGKI